MHVLVGGVAVSDDQCLMAAEAQALEQQADRMIPAFAAEMLGRIQTEAYVVYGFLGAGPLTGVSTHDQGGPLGVVHSV